MSNIFILGSKGIPANYGGFETFVENLVKKKKSQEINYIVSCLCDEHTCADCEAKFTSCVKPLKGAMGSHFKFPSMGPAVAVVYDLFALNNFIKAIKRSENKNSIIYILACRIGPFMWWFKRKTKKLGVNILVNPDGHEWKRKKWNYFIRQYWKLSERLMIKHADLVVCDNLGIEEYILNDYKKYKPKTTFIAYGAFVEDSPMSKDDPIYTEWLAKHSVKQEDYYLVVGRFVPENNYELMIKEYMKSSTKKDLVIITNVQENKFYNYLLKETKFNEDPRIKFVGTVYNQDLLMKIREDAYGYIHGHAVGGTNPSLLEALASTKLNLLFDVSFNKLVGKDSAMYFSDKSGSLSKSIKYADQLTQEEICNYAKMSTEIIINEYSWDMIIDKYETLFMKQCDSREEILVKNIEEVDFN